MMKASLGKLLFGVSVLAGLTTGCSQSNGNTSDNTNQETNGTTAAAKGPGEKYQLREIAEGLTSPVDVTHAGDGSGRLFVVEQPGRIRLLKNGKLAPQPFLDLKNRVVELDEGYSEMGLLGLVFHPGFKTNGRFYVYYSAPTQKKGVNHESVIAEYKVSPNNPDQAGMTEKVLMRIDQPESNHNGGDMVFGKDGFLYIALGDGGGAGDKHGETGNGQNLNTLLGKIIRIDVDKGNPYSIPADNPFVGKAAKPEIWAYGLRNPWRFSFDRQTGQLFCADVGQNEYEEVNIIEKGQNYGWRAMEARHVFDERLNETVGKTVLPISEYPHGSGISITGGYVYRGTQYPPMQGKYYFADWSGRFFYLEKSGNQWKHHELNIDGDNQVDFRINSFGEDENGELYVATQQDAGAVQRNGVLYQLIPGEAAGQ